MINSVIMYPPMLDKLGVCTNLTQVSKLNVKNLNHN